DDARHVPPPSRCRPDRKSENSLMRPADPLHQFRPEPPAPEPGQPTNTPLGVTVPNGSSDVDAGSAVPNRSLPRYTRPRLGCPAPLPTARSARASPSALTVATDTSAPA